MSSAATEFVVALVPAAGRGVRLGESTPKAFVPVAGIPMIRRAVDGLLASGAVHRVVVVVPAELVELAATLLPDGVQVIVGGAERLDSVRAGIDAAPDADLYLVHDAARALTPPALIARVVSELRNGRSGVVPALPVTDTIKSVDSAGRVTGTPARADLRAIQTPQGFAADVLRRAYDGVVEGDLATDDAGLVERLGEQVATIVGDPLAFKITTPLDLTLANALAREEG
ncbi:2-C-methyl-D-erythritol 4-phosphate cytidylyltransferase [Antrihabitans cavernicola]|uniref:2-C-methyl-D-erythritol 4-phosphate cytidylyltransferase n=1 Tax=Antrihabitans cavernicola TaxID=2495913 RepID=A0A5A7S798_9NOCA|nr:2-C-methyl-D-erythritol 4-phosphate cytidylyltransferase [Spelaeibacter cavernicola]KAA0022020.1 2-C-methyl-D-erythritol 4-phosphate cytidylyltransferase [Spelaeibacter cavernicola]